LSDITSKYRTIVVLVVIDLLAVLHTQFVDAVIICLHTKFHIPSSIDSIFVATESKTKRRIHAGAMLLSHII